MPLPSVALNPLSHAADPLEPANRIRLIATFAPIVESWYVRVHAALNPNSLNRERTEELPP